MSLAGDPCPDKHLIGGSLIGHAYCLTPRGKKRQFLTTRYSFNYSGIPGSSLSLTTAIYFGGVVDADIMRD
jgi:hypothetical protein